MTTEIMFWGTRIYHVPIKATASEAWDLIPEDEPWWLNYLMDLPCSLNVCNVN